jgi:O-antigen ligase
LNSLSGTFVETSQVKVGRLRRGERGFLEIALVIFLCGTLIFAVLAFGAVDDRSTFAFESATAALFLLWMAKQIVRGQLEFSRNPLYRPALVFFGIIAAQLVFRQSAYWYVTKHEALRYVSYGIVFLVAAECVVQEKARRMFALVMGTFGAFYALFALVQQLRPNGKIFWVHSPKLAGSMIYGSYVNSNHYAGLMEMLVPIPLVLSMGHLLKGGQRILAGSSAALMASTIFLSLSRGGMIALSLEIVLFAALTLPKRRSSRAVAGIMSMSVLVLAILLLLGKGQVLGRLGDLSPGIRLDITRDCLRMFTRHPVLGWGLGTFPTVYPGYRSFYTNLFINEAHNDYAQLLVETGLLGFGLMLWFLVLLYQFGLPTSRRWEFKWDGAVSLAALLGCTGMLFHSFVDFNLQIPANAALFYVLCALAASELPASSSRSKLSALQQPTET